MVSYAKPVHTDLLPYIENFYVRTFFKKFYQNLIFMVGVNCKFFSATNLYFVGVNIFLCLQFLLLVATTKYFNNKNFLLVVTSISTGHLHVFVKLLAIEWSIKFLVTQFSLVIFVVKLLSKFWLQ